MPSWNPARALAPHLTALAGHRGGNVAILFGFLSVPLVMIGGVAVDYGFATRLETKLQAATDATALLLCQTPLATTAPALNDMASTTMKGQMGETNLTVDPLIITSNPRQITLTTHKTQTAFFGKFTSVKTLNPGATARCATPLPARFEIAMVLDNTGSMKNTGDDGVSKMSALKTAAKKFVEFVFTSDSFAVGTRISIVPFAASVAIDTTNYTSKLWIDRQGKSKYHWTNITGAAAAGFDSRFDIFTRLKGAYSGWGWAGCFDSLPYPQNVTDVATSGNDTLYVPYFAPDEGGKGSGGLAYFDQGKNYVSYNSYIDDFNNINGCTEVQAQNNATSFMAAESRACKYVLPRNASAGTYFDELGPNGPNFGCTTRPLQTLTTNKTTLNNLIDSMNYGGVTNIHEGMMWGWRTISPNSVLADGTASAYNTADVNKIIVLMTDGENTWFDWSSGSYKNPNKSLYSSNGFFVSTDGTNSDAHFPPENQNVTDGTKGRAALDALTRKSCQNAATAGIRIFTIGLSVSSDQIDAKGIQLLKDCAASGGGQYFQANDSNSLIKAFKDIGASIGSLRLTR